MSMTLADHVRRFCNDKRQWKQDFVCCFSHVESNRKRIAFVFAWFSRKLSSWFWMKEKNISSRRENKSGMLWAHLLNFAKESRNRSEDVWKVSILEKSLKLHEATRLLNCYFGANRQSLLKFNIMSFHVHCPFRWVFSPTFLQSSSQNRQSCIVFLFT